MSIEHEMLKNLHANDMLDSKETKLNVALECLHKAANLLDKTDLSDKSETITKVIELISNSIPTIFSKFANNKKLTCCECGGEAQDNVKIKKTPKGPWLPLCDKCNRELEEEEQREEDWRDAVLGRIR